MPVAPLVANAAVLLVDLPGTCTVLVLVLSSTGSEMLYIVHRVSYWI